MRRKRNTYELFKFYGKWTVLEKYYGKYYWCLCACGTVKYVSIQELRQGTSVSCGCSRKIHLYTTRKNGTKFTPEYTSWLSMRRRCLDPKHDKYKYYGLRGITIAPEWRSFDTFLKDMGKRPAGKTLDRIDNNLGYSKNNCRWATHSEQMKNRRSFSRTAKNTC